MRLQPPLSYRWLRANGVSRLVPWHFIDESKGQFASAQFATENPSARSLYTFARRQDRDDFAGFTIVEVRHFPAVRTATSFQALTPTSGHFFGRSSFQTRRTGSQMRPTSKTLKTRKTSGVSHRTKLTIFCLLLSGPMLWFLGGYLQRIYGLDPPYAIFYLGFFMQPIGVFCIMAALIVAAVHQFRKRAKSDEGV